MDDLIRFYYLLGLKQREIVSCLQYNHNIIISMRQLQRRLNRLNLFRRKNFTDILTVAQFIQEQTVLHGQLHGYRWMHLKCLHSNFNVTQQTIRQLLRIIDPDGVSSRRRRRLRRRQYYNKGPNFLWHIDCYDKLKPFGICISGCIDGFSRHIMWLNAGINSNDPAIIAYHFLETVKKIGGYPQTVRADMGTENGIIEQIQIYLQEHSYYPVDDENALPPFLYGTSPANQRIEAWWSILRKHHSQFWLNLFNHLKDHGLFSGTFLDRSLMQFCFLKIIQDELDTFVFEWNIHQIAGSRNSISPNGRPFILYNNPEMYNAASYLRPVTDHDIDICSQICRNPGTLPCDTDVCELALIIMEENELQMPQEPFDAVTLYTMLREELTQILS